MRHNVVAKALAEELAKLAGETKKYSEAINSAKTQLKKEYFSKKLKKASKEAEKVIFAIARLQEKNEKEEDNV